MISRPFAIVDPSAGISGDMLLGALLDAGAPQAWLEGLPARLGLDDVAVRVHPVTRCGVSAIKVDVSSGGSVEPPHDVVEHDHAHSDGRPHSRSSHQHGQDAVAHDHPPHAHAPHRHVGELLRIIEAAPLSAWVKDRALRAFRLLGEQEGAIHGVPADQVALHEVGAMDALVDIVGGIEGFEQLGITRIYNRRVTLGSGWVSVAHGTMAVPAPVTLRLLEGIEVGPDGPVRGEATTPTGAVLLRVLSQGHPPENWRPVRSGWGAGGRNPDTYPNALRLIVAESVAEAAEIVMLATDIDDLSPEYVEPLRSALVAAGALDVQVWPTMAKKGRVSFRIEALATAATEAQVIQSFFRHSTTAGVRRTDARREVLARREMAVRVADGEVRVKILDTADGPRAKAEFDDIMRVASRTGRPAHDLAREIQQRALDMLGGQSVRPVET
jgi:hypothetical protein